MRRSPSNPAALRAEARLLTVAGLLLLATGFPATLLLVGEALGGNASPILPATVGAPPLLLGYIACRLASDRLIKAKALEGPRRAP